MNLVIRIEGKTFCDRIHQVCISATEAVDSLFGITYPIGMAIALGNQFRKTVENLQLDGIGILELIHHNQLKVLLHIVLNLLLIGYQVQEKLFHVIIRNDMVPLLVLYIVITPFLGQIEYRFDERFQNSKLRLGYHHSIQLFYEIREPRTVSLNIPCLSSRLQAYKRKQIANIITMVQYSL